MKPPETKPGRLLISADPPNRKEQEESPKKDQTKQAPNPNIPYRRIIE